MEVAGTQPDIVENLCLYSEASAIYVQVVTVVVLVVSSSYLVFILTKACYYLIITLRSDRKETFLLCLSLF